jgi:hypothetical protein
MLAKRGGKRLIGLVASTALVGLIVVGCVPGKVEPTPIIVVVTPSPTPIATPRVTPTHSPTPAPSPIETSTPEATTTPPIATEVPATTCTGSASNQAFWAEAAGKMSWDVYCPVLPSGWYVKTGNYSQPGGGQIQMTFKGPGTATLEVDEGAFCIGSGASCAPSLGSLGTANFADRPGALESRVGGGFALYVAPGTSKAYTLIGTGMSQSKFVELAAALAKVAKS